MTSDECEGLFRIPKPDKYWGDETWATMSSEAKGFVLLRELLEDGPRSNQGKRYVDPSNIRMLNLGKGPTFWSSADEDMFFNTLYSLASFVDVKGIDRDLHLYHDGILSNEEKNLLVSLMRRYNMSIPGGL